MKKLLCIGFILGLFSSSVFAFNQADLDRFLAGDANMAGADLSGMPGIISQLQSATLHNFNFKGANFENAHLDSFHFINCDFTNANLKGANLKYTIFNGSNLYKTDFSNADLSLAAFGSSKLNKTNFKNANLTQARIMGNPENIAYVLFQDANFQNADLSQARFSYGTLTTEVKLSANLNQTTLMAKRFTGATFHQTVFRHLRISRLFERFFESKDINMDHVQWFGGTMKNQRVKKITPHIPKAVQHRPINKF